MKAPKAQATYEAALEAERLRERQWRRTRQGAFESSFVSFDANTECYYPLAAVISSKKCKDPKSLATKRRRAYLTAYNHVWRHAPECIDVFRLILKNGNNRQESIWEMVKKTIKRIKTNASSTTSKKSNTTGKEVRSSASSALSKGRVKN